MFGEEVMSKDMDYDLTVILPAYNEEENLEKCVHETIKSFNQLKKSYEIIIIENGSKDKTFEIAKKLVESHSFITAVHLDIATVTGAIRRGYELARGKVVINLDVDLATEMSHLEELVSYTDNFDIVTGSRYLDKTGVKRTWNRLLLSLVFNNILVRGLLGSKLKDNNCGFRAFKREVGINLYRDVKDNYFFGLVEIMIRAQKRGYKIKEFPVKWTENSRKIGVKRIMQFLIPGLKLWIEFLTTKPKI